MYQRELWVALKAARAGAHIVREGFGSAVGAEYKGRADPVTEIDRSSERHILEVIHHHFPDDPVLAEESAGSGTPGKAPRVWVVDPLDGTVNFIHAIPHIAVSVALWVEGRAAAGVVIDVMHGEEFTATASGGAYSGGNPITVSPQESLGLSLVATGFPYDHNVHGAAYAANLGQVLTLVQGVRRLGSAALDLAWVASGRYEGYWEFGLKPWDMAAGVLLVKEAGGAASTPRGEDCDLGDTGIVASNGLIHEGLLAAVGTAIPPHLQ